jgi:predicted PurR-regulated permease PerM
MARWALVGIALYLIGWLFMRAQSALTPFIIGLVLAYLLLPTVNWLNRRMPRWVAILLVYIGLGTIGFAAFTFIVPPTILQIRQLIESIPSLTELEKVGADLLQLYRTNLPEELRVPIDQAVASVLDSLQSNLSGYAQSVGGFVVLRVAQAINTVMYLVGLLLIPIWLFYVLNDQAKGAATINALIHPAARPDFWNIWSIINAVLSNYVRGQLLLGLAVGAAVAIGLTALRLLGFGIPYILLLSIIAGVTELIPIIGPIIGAIPAVIIAFSVSPTAGVAVLLLYVVVQQLENNFLVPRIVGESIGIHPAVLSVVLLAMGQVFGIVGIILSAPLLAILRDLFVYAYRRLSYADPQAARTAVHEQAA